MAQITLRGRVVPLEYTTYEMKQIQEEIAPIGKAIALMMGRNPEDETDMTQFAGAGHLEALGKAIRIMGNAGLEMAGEEPNLTDKAVLRMLKPPEIAAAMNACTEAMDEGMRSEIPPEEETGPVDVTLEEMKKKTVREANLFARCELGTDSGPDTRRNTQTAAGRGDGSVYLPAEL